MMIVINERTFTTRDRILDVFGIDINNLTSEDFERAIQQSKEAGWKVWEEAWERWKEAGYVELAVIE